MGKVTGRRKCALHSFFAIFEQSVHFIDQGLNFARICAIDAFVLAQPNCCQSFPQTAERRETPACYRNPATIDIKAPRSVNTEWTPRGIGTMCTSSKENMCMHISNPPVHNNEATINRERSDCMAKGSVPVKSREYGSRIRALSQ